MNLRQIEVFRAVMLAGSVTNAARMLHVSQPGISRMLAHIELQTGIALFHRIKGKLQPTPEAQALYAEVEQVYRGVERIDDKARELRAGGGPTLRVLCSPSTALEAVPRAVSELSQRFAAARLYMETQLVREMVEQLSRRQADVAISTLPIDHALLASEVVGNWTLVCAFTAGHPLEARRTLQPRDVMAHALISFSSDTPQGRLIADWCAESGLQARSQIEVRAGQAACALAATGAGIAIVDDLTARAWQGSGALRYRPLALAPVFDAYAVHNVSYPPSVLGRAFIERVKLALRQLRRPAKAS